MRCAVCCRQAKGYGWFNPRLKPNDPARTSDRWVFCCRRCQDAFCHLMNKTEGRMIDPSEMEIAAMQACLQPLGEYVGEIGMQFGPHFRVVSEAWLGTDEAVGRLVAHDPALAARSGSSPSSS